MHPETMTILQIFGTVITTISASVAAYAAMKSVKTWKQQSKFESRRDAVSAWIGGAAIFKGKLKFIYSEEVNWEKNKNEIEYISKHFWNWVSLWPYTKACLCGDLKKEAETLWANVFSSYKSCMDGSGKIVSLEKSVEAIYNSNILEQIIDNQN